MGAVDGKTAIVTGAGRGIGRGEALLLAREGARVVVNDLGADEAQQVVDEIVAGGGEAVANTDDVATWDGAGRLVGQAVDTWGRLDILVNNAGILRDAMSFNMTEADWDAVVNVHLKGHFAPCHFAAKHWRDRGKAGDEVGGRIVNTVSESGLFGNAGQANYAAAKAGIASMTIVIARELKKYNVTANCIAPRARTRLTATVAGAEDYMSGPEWDPENIAPTVVFLASDAAADISGHVFVVWGPKVHLMNGWWPETSIDRGEGRWSVDELAARKDELFAKSSGKIPPMGFGL